MEFTFDNNIPIYIQLLEYMKINYEKIESAKHYGKTLNCRYKKP